MSIPVRHAATVALFAFLVLPVGGAEASGEGEILAQGRSALQKKECERAYWTLQRMPASGRSDGEWLLTTARAAECLKRYEDALLFYRKYSKAEPNVPEVMEKIAEMNTLLDQEAKKRYGGGDETPEKGKKNEDTAPPAAAGAAAAPGQTTSAASASSSPVAAPTAPTAPAAPSAPPAAGGTGNFQMQQVPAYSGRYSSEVSQLLQRSPSQWKTPSCITCTDGVPPQVPSSLPCQRDSYVYAALTAAWGVESYARVGEAAKAESTAALVRQNLDNADSLCSNAPSVGPGVTCVTLDIWPCR